MTIEVEVREIKQMLEALHEKIDSLVEERETKAMMVVSQQSLRDFLANEQDLYSVKDLKLTYW